MKIIQDILQSFYFADQPPVLIDIGASGEINAKWKTIAPYSVCIAFDADDRDFQVNEKTNAGYKKLISLNRIVTAATSGEQLFYLTASPYCSSLLEPDKEKLAPWVFNKLFEVEKTTTLPAITLADALQQAGVDRVDWFKSDTQGTDLRLFQSLPTGIKTNVLAAEFEPGIMDAYKGEDKLHMVMSEMEGQSFWLSSMEVKGTQRLSASYAPVIGSAVLKRVIRISPCWAEVTYLRKPFPEASPRQLLLLIVFALLEKQFGFALELADHAIGKFDDPVFKDCKNAVLGKISKEKWKVPIVILKRQFNKLLSNIND
jgi:hypothetical protein